MVSINRRDEMYFPYLSLCSTLCVHRRGAATRHSHTEPTGDRNHEFCRNRTSAARATGFGGRLRTAGSGEKFLRPDCRPGGYVRPVPQEQEFPLAHFGAAFPRVLSASGRTE